MLINTGKIRLLAAQQGMNLAQLSEKAGVSRQTLSTTLTRGTCRAETAVKLYQALGINPSELIESDVAV